MLLLPCSLLTNIFLKGILPMQACKLLFFFLWDCLAGVFVLFQQLFLTCVEFDRLLTHPFSIIVLFNTFFGFFGDSMYRQNSRFNIFWWATSHGVRILFFLSTFFPLSFSILVCLKPFFTYSRSLHSLLFWLISHDIILCGVQNKKKN